MSYLSTDQSKQLRESYQSFKRTSDYEKRKEQSKFCDFARAFIRYLIEHQKFDKKSATLLVKIFAVRAKRSTIEDVLRQVVTEDNELEALSDLLDQCTELGYTAKGLIKVNLTPKQATVVASFIKQILESKNIDEIRSAIATYTEHKIPNCTAGIYSPWLHYIHPTMCPIANGAIEPYLDFVGVPKSKKVDYLLMMDVLEEAKEATGAENYSVLDSFLFNKDNFLRVMQEQPNNIHSAKYWIVNHTYDEASPEDKQKLILQAVTSNYVMMQYEYGYQSTAAVTTNWKQAMNVREGDYIFLRCDHLIYAVGRAIRPRLKPTVELSAKSITGSRDNKIYISGKCNDVIIFNDAEVFYENLLDGNKENWGQRIDVDAWQYYIPDGVSHDIDTYEDNYPHNAIREINSKIGENILKKLYKGLGMKADVLEQIKESHNLILTGAPGTGKTYMAKQVARLMLFGKAEDEELNDSERAVYEQHVEFVQFHPNYDYTDFVEGLRPVESQDGSSLGFERKDGVFKSLCKRAIAEDDSVVDNFEEAWSALTTAIDDNDFVEVQLLSGKGSFLVEMNEYGTGLASRTYADNQFVKDQWISGKSKFFSKDQLRNIYHGFAGVPAGGHDNYRRAIVEHMKTNFGLKDYKQGKKKADGKPYILIIDEINRGEMSKILGELFFAIDPGYRGIKGRIDTQYQNLIGDADVFKKGFYVPENVYIIGTMNDIDRSVESMDFAIRRRFAWMEVLASDTEYILNTLDDSIRQSALDKMKRLNDAILDPDFRLGTDYQIGATYFLKLQKNPDFENLWNRSLKVVLKEYLRGQRDIEDKLNKLYEAYKG